MSGKQVRAGGATVEIGVRDKTQAALQRAAAKLRSFGNVATSIGAGLVAASAGIGAAITAATQHFSTVGDRADKMASRLGMSTEAVTELAHAADLSGTSIERVEAATRKMQDTLALAANGSKQGAEALGRFGLSAADLASMSPDQQLALFADRMAGIENPTERTAAMLDVFGKAGTELIPLLAGGSAGLDDMRKAARSLGLSLDRDTVSKAAKLNDALGTMKTTVSGVVVQVGAAFADVFTEAANAVTEVAAEVSRFVRNNQELVVTVGAAVASIGAFGAGLIGLGTSLKVTAFAMDGLKLATVQVGAVLGAVFSPVGLAVAGITAAVAAAGAAVWYFAKPWEAIGPAVKTAFNSIKGIASLLAKADFRGAADLAMSAIKAVFLKGVNGIMQMWQNTIARILGLSQSKLPEVGGIMSRVTDTIKSAFASVWPTIQVGLSAFISFANDLLGQLPQIAGYALGKMVREAALAWVKFSRWVNESMVSLAGALLKSFADFGPKLLKALITGGDVDSVAGEIGSALNKALKAQAMVASGLFAGLTNGEAPDFKLSDRTKAAQQQLVQAIAGADKELSAKLQAALAGNKSPAGQPGKQDVAGLKVADASKVSVDDTALEKYQKRLLELREGLAANKLTAAEFAKGVEQLKRELVGIEPGPVDKFRERLILLNQAAKDGKITAAEWSRAVQDAQQQLLGIENTPAEQFAKQIATLRQALSAGFIDQSQFDRAAKQLQSSTFNVEAAPIEKFRQRLMELNQAYAANAITAKQWRQEVEKTRQEIFGLDSSPLQQFSDRIGQLHEALRSNAISFSEYSGEFKKAQEAFLGFDPSPIETFAARLRDLKAAFDGQQIDAGTFKQAALNALPDQLKDVVAKTQSPMDAMRQKITAFRDQLKQLQLLRDAGQIGDAHFQRAAGELGKGLFADAERNVQLSSEGTFNASAAAQMGVGGINDKAFTAQQEANSLLKLIAERVKGRFLVQ